MSNTKAFLFVLLLSASHFSHAVHVSSKSNAHSASHASSEEMEAIKYFLAEEQSQVQTEPGTLNGANRRCRQHQCVSYCEAYNYGKNAWFAWWDLVSDLAHNDSSRNNKSYDGGKRRWCRINLSCNNDSECTSIEGVQKAGKNCASDSNCDGSGNFYA